MKGFHDQLETFLLRKVINLIVKYVFKMAMLLLKRLPQRN